MGSQMQEGGIQIHTWWGKKIISLACFDSYCNFVDYIGVLQKNYYLVNVYSLLFIFMEKIYLDTVILIKQKNIQFIDWHRNLKVTKMALSIVVSKIISHM